MYIYGDYRGQMILGNDTLFNSAYPDSDMFFSKLDTSGNFIWTKFFGGPYLDQVCNLTTDVIGNLIIGGYYSEEITIEDTTLISPYGITKEAIVAKFDGDGNLIWALDGKGPNNDRVQLCTNYLSLNTYISKDILLME